jgi:hypothetical protein
MRKLLAIAALCTLALTACAPARMTDNEFLGLIHSHATTMVNVPDSTIMNFVTTSCKALEGGASKADVLAVIENSPYSQAIKEDMGYTLGAGVPVYCPDQKDKL